MNEMKYLNLINNKKDFIECARSLKNKEINLNLGVTDLSFHRVTAALITYILTEMGCIVNRNYSLHEENFFQLKEEKIDMLCSAWIPSSHGIYKEFVEKDIELIELGLHYNPYALWGVPDYIPKNQVNQISDLLKPDIKNKMINKIQGIGLGAGITRFSIKMMEKYSLKEAGYYFNHGSQEDCVKAFKDAVKNKEWIVVPLWQPQFLHYSYKIRELKEPLGLLGGIDKAVLLCNKNNVETFFNESQLELLDNIVLSNKIISELDYYHSVEGLTEDEAVKKWFSKY